MLVHGLRECPKCPKHGALGCSKPELGPDNGLLQVTDSPVPLPDDFPTTPAFDDHQHLIGYVDAAHANDLRNCRSTTGMPFFFPMQQLPTAPNYNLSPPPAQLKLNLLLLSFLPKLHVIFASSSMNLVTHNLVQHQFTTTMYWPSK